MTAERDVSTDWPGWSATGPFLAIAYPVTTMQYLGGEFCSPLCFAPTPMGVLAVVGSVVAVLLAVVLLVTLFGLHQRDPDSSVARWFVSPPPAAALLAVTIFVLFVAALTLDAMTIEEHLWNPVALPLSLGLFAPVWALYAGAFPLSFLLSALGLEFSPTLTLAYRGVILVVGFPLSAVLQVVGASWLVTRLGLARG